MPALLQVAGGGVEIQGWGHNVDLSRTPLSPSPPLLVMQRQQGGERGRLSLGSPGCHLYPLFLSQPHPTSHHRPPKPRKENEPELSAGLLDLGLPGSASSALLE